MTQREEEIASTMPADLDALPRLRGFRLRGMEMTRLETFIDAAFAFAITMLVIATGQVPDNIGTLLAAFKNVPAFLASIAVLARFWRGHWLWSRRYGLEDVVSVVISWMMLVTILIFVYPLKMLFGAMFYYLSGHRVGQLIQGDTEGQARALFAVYAIGTAAISLEILLLNLRAWQLRGPLRLDERERLLTGAEILGWSIPVGIGLLSLTLALTLPMRELVWSGWIYFLLFVLLPLNRQWLKGKMRKI
jgi:Endosomal/lysosomal potassium channel TMEM175